MGTITFMLILKTGIGMKKNKEDDFSNQLLSFNPKGKSF
jgi:hypothetical protein